jgi:cob(I)alamin adenosyltransferase
VPKDAPRVEAYGTVDELNATLGLARLHAEGELAGMLARIQNDLFDLGADLCRPDMAKDAEAGYTPLRMTDAQVDRLEAEIDAMNANLRRCAASSCPAARRWRRICTCAAPSAAGPSGGGRTGPRARGQPAALRYLNRLSDWLFVAGRIANDNGATTSCGFRARTAEAAAHRPWTASVPERRSPARRPPAERGVEAQERRIASVFPEAEALGSRAEFRSVRPRGGRRERRGHP